MNYRPFLRSFVAKCDCCKRVTAIVGKMEVVASNGALAGELQLCANCLPLISDAPSPSSPEVEYDADYDDEISDEELDHLLSSGRRLF